MQFFNPYNYKILILTIISTVSDMVAIVLLFPILKITLGGDSQILNSIMATLKLDISVNQLLLFEVSLICIAAITKIYLIQQIAHSAEEVRKSITLDSLSAVYNWTLKDYKNVGSTDLSRKILSETDIFVANYVYPVYSLYLHFTVIVISIFTLLITDASTVIYAGGFLTLLLGFLLLVVNRKLKHLASERETLNSGRFKYVTDRVDAFEDQHFFPSLSKGDTRHIALFDRFALVNSSSQTISQIAKPVFEFVIFCLLLLAGFFLVSGPSNAEQMSDDKVIAIAAALYRLLPGVAGIYQARAQIKIGSVASQTIGQVLDGAVHYGETPVHSNISNLSATGIEISHENQLIYAPDATFIKGEVTLISGPSGCGKSSFLHVICGLAPLESGSLEINGDKLDAYLNLNWFNKVSYVAQKPHFVGRIVSDNFSTSEHSQLEALLLQFGLINSHLTFKDLLVRELDTLSGGQLQKIALARAALKASEVILLDEALNAQDALSVQNIMNTLRRLDRIVLVVSHEVQIEQYCDKVVSF